MKKIGIYFDEPEAMGFPLSKSNYYEAYVDFFVELKENGLEPFLVRSMSTYLGNGIFSSSWQFDESSRLVEVGRAKVDLIFDKGSDGTLAVSDVAVVNDLRLRSLCNDKIKTQELFSDISPQIWPVSSSNEVMAVVEDEGLEHVVFKPVDGWGADGVCITADRDVLQKHVSDGRLYPAIVQRFIDTSDGISGVVEGAHDLRAVVINGDIVTAYIRKPAEGSLLANISKGGSLNMLPVDNLPQSARDIVDRVDSVLAKDFPYRIYSVDMVYELGTKPWLIELNAKPGLNPKSSSPGAARVIARIAQLLSEID